MKDSKQNRSREIMRQIHDVLWNDWDPIGVNDCAPDDEYDSYISSVYKILSDRPDEYKLTKHLLKLETNSMGLSSREETHLLPVVRKLMEIDVSL